jgi:DNA-binding CsgD family transcriptional regulator/nitrate/nitrite-specific signal transduction histidine kinase
VSDVKFKQLIEVNTVDTIDPLEDRFSLMSAELYESYSFLEKRVVDLTRELAILNSIIFISSHSLDIQEILEIALNKVVEQMGFDTGSAFRLEPGMAVPVLMVNQGFESNVAVNLISRHAETNQFIPPYPDEVSVLRAEDFLNNNLVNEIRLVGLRQVVYVPIATRERVLGFFVLGKYELGQFSPDILSFFDLIDKQIGIAIENACLCKHSGWSGAIEEWSRLTDGLHSSVSQDLFSSRLIGDVMPRSWKHRPDKGITDMDTLTQREKEVARLLARGLSYAEISRKLNITENTLKSHIKNIYNKLEVSNRTCALLKCKEFMPLDLF